MITFRGKNIQLKFTYKSIHLMELAFEQPYSTFVEEQTEFNQSLYVFWAMLQNEPDYFGVSVTDVAELLQQSLEEYEFTLPEYFAKVNKAYQDSVIVKQLFETDPDSQPLPRRGGRQSRASVIRRKVFYGIMRRLRNFSQRFLDKHSM